MVKTNIRNLLLGLAAAVAIGVASRPASAQSVPHAITTTMRKTGVTVPKREIQTLFHSDDEDEPVHIVLNGKAVTEDEFAALQERQSAMATYKPGIPQHPGIEPNVAGYLYETYGLNAYQTGGWLPPDDSFAIGVNSAIQPANDAVGIFARSNTGLTLQALTDGNSFVNFFGATTFDPRAVYDYATGHFFISFATFPYQDANNAWHMVLTFAVSKTNDAFGAWATYALDYDTADTSIPAQDIPGLLFDYPDVGMDANNVYVTGNIFGAVDFLGSTLIAFDKASMEKGLANVPSVIYHGLNSTLTPPYVWSAGKSKQSYCLFNQPGSQGSTSNTGYIGMYAITGKVKDGSIKLSSPYNVTVPYYDVPGYAEQPGWVIMESLDTRFQDKSTQIGENVYNANCVDLFGFPMVTAYQMNGATAKLTQSINMITSPTSSDFNASIAVNSSGVAVVNWNSTDISKTIANNNVYESVRTVTLGKVWGNKPRAGTLVPGASSSYDYEFYRNGDYSMTVVDPIYSQQFWGIDQTVLDSFDWNTYIFQLSVK